MSTRQHELTADVAELRRMSVLHVRPHGDGGGLLPAN